MTAALANLHPDLQDLVGRTIADRYRVDSLLGVGGMGAVFRAHHLGLARDVAIKVLHPSLTRDPEISSRFDREARSASRLDHPNCLQVTDYGTTEHDMKFMVMQLLDGGELTALLGKPMPPLRALELALQICRGLEHAHGQGVIHRDVKPENVFVTRDHEDRETLKLVDFGIAKIASGGPAEQHKTRAGLIFGTPAYMSPEQAAGVEADDRADLYSLGIILYEMLAGWPPFRADDPVALVRMQVGADPPPLPPDTAPMIAAIVERLLAKRRDERFASAKELRDILESALVMLRGEPKAAGVVQSAAASLQSGGIPLGVTPGHSTGVPLAQLVGHTGAISAPLPVGTAAPRHTLAIFAGVVAMGLLAVWVFASNGEGDDAPAVVAEAVAGPGTSGAAPGGDEDEVAVVVASGPEASALGEIDRLLLAGQLDEADKLLAAQRDRFPKDAQLSWRLGRLLTKRKGKRSQALAAYGDAVDADPTLLDDGQFYIEVHEVLRTPGARDEALDLALHLMGRYAHSFLLELVNSEKKPLSYAKRHRALDELLSDEGNRALVNWRLNTALDLLQSPQSLTPCRAYDEALTVIMAAPDYYYLPRVERAAAPKADSGGAREGPEACGHLEAKRQAALTLLAALEPTETDTDGEIVIEDDGSTAPAVTPTPTPTPAPTPAVRAPGGGSSKRKKSANKDCERLRGVFKKRCWK